MPHRLDRPLDDLHQRQAQSRLGRQAHRSAVSFAALNPLPERPTRDPSPSLTWADAIIDALLDGGIYDRMRQRQTEHVQHAATYITQYYRDRRPQRIDPETTHRTPPRTATEILRRRPITDRPSWYIPDEITETHRHQEPPPMAANDIPRVSSLLEFFENHGDQPIHDPALITTLGIPSHNNYHQWRDAIRWKAETYIKPNISFDQEIDDLHNVRLAADDPLLLAFTDTEKAAQADRPKQMKVGKYLNAYYAHKFTPEQIRDIATQHRADFGPPTLHFTTDADEVEHVYENGPNSCMKRERGYVKSATHPVRVYATDDVCVAYLKKNTKITARTVINKKDKTWIKIYGDRHVLQQMLTDEGYHHGSLNGCKIQKLHDPDKADNAYLMPYLDGAATRCTIMGDHIMVSDKGPIGGSVTDNYIYGGTPAIDTEVALDNEEARTCSHCGGEFTDDELYDQHIIQSSETGETQEQALCEECLDNHYTDTIDNRGHHAFIRSTAERVTAGNGRVFPNLTIARTAGYVLPFNNPTLDLIHEEHATHCNFQGFFIDPSEHTHIPINCGGDTFATTSAVGIDNPAIWVNPYTDLANRYATANFVSALPAVRSARYIPVAHYIERLQSAPSPEPSALSAHMNRGRRSNHSQWIYESNDPLLRHAARPEETSHAA